MESIRNASKTPAQALQAWRYAVAPQAYELLDVPKVETTPSAKWYSSFTRRFEVEGDVTAEVDVDATGRVLSTSVVQRNIQVPGIRGVRPVAFETVLDDASRVRIQALRPTLSQPDEFRDGQAQRLATFSWRLK